MEVRYVGSVQDKNRFQVIEYTERATRYYQGRKYRVAKNHKRFVNPLDQRATDFITLDLSVITPNGHWGWILTRYAHHTLNGERLYPAPF